ASPAGRRRGHGGLRPRGGVAGDDAQGGAPARRRRGDARPLSGARAGARVKVWLNGALVEAESGCISPFDHGVLVGDGVFETLRCYAGVPFALADHLARLAGVKTISLAGSAMALAEARSQGASEAIILNRAGNVCEATTANVFAVRGGEVATPALDSGCLPGITRERVLALCADLGIGVA